MYKVIFQTLLWSCVATTATIPTTNVDTRGNEIEQIRRLNIANMHYQHEQDIAAAATVVERNGTNRRQRSTVLDATKCKFIVSLLVEPCYQD